MTDEVKDDTPNQDEWTYRPKGEPDGSFVMGAYKLFYSRMRSSDRLDAMDSIKGVLGIARLAAKLHDAANADESLRETAEKMGIEAVQTMTGEDVKKMLGVCVKHTIRIEGMDRWGEMSDEEKIDFFDDAPMGMTIRYFKELAVRK